MKFVVDTREKDPWDLGVECVHKKLDSGDYSILTLEDRVAIERKTLDDLVQSVIHERSRFFDELKRLTTYKYAYVVVEGSLRDLLVGNYRSHAHPNSVLGSTISMIADYRIPVFMCSDRQAATKFSHDLLTYIGRKEEVHSHE